MCRAFDLKGEMLSNIIQTPGWPETYLRRSLRTIWYNGLATMRRLKPSTDLPRTGRRASILPTGDARGIEPPFPLPYVPNVTGGAPRPFLQRVKPRPALQMEHETGVFSRSFRGVARFGVVGARVDLTRDTMLVNAG